MAQVKINNLTKNFGSLTVLKQISLHIQNGEFLTLLGPSGCGKSTLLRIIAGLEAPCKGEVHIADRCVNNVAPKDRDIAMVFQSYALYPHLSVFDNIAMPLKMRMLTTLERLPVLGPLLPKYRQKRKRIRSKVKGVATLLDIGHLLQRKPSQISGGQRQRVALGRAMVRNPKVFLMDEPLSNLDAKLRVHMRTEIAGLHRKLKSTFIYVTHDQAEAMTMSDRIALMIDGVLLQVGPPKQIYDNPKNLRVAEFLGNPKINLIPGTIWREGIIESFGTRLPISLAPRENNCAQIQIGVRPEALQIVKNGGHGWKGRVVHLEHLGAYFLVHTLIDGMEHPVISRVAATQMEIPETDDKIRLRALTDHILLFGEDGNRIEIHPETLGEAVNA